MSNKTYNCFNLKQQNIRRNTLSRKSIFRDSFSTRRDSSFTPFYLLPIIDKKIMNKAFQKPSSILTKYIQKHTHDLIRTTNEDLNRPIEINQMQVFSEPNKKKRKAMIKSRNKKTKKTYLKTKKEFTDININKITDSNNNQENFYITETLNENLKLATENEETIKNNNQNSPDISTLSQQKATSFEDIISQISFNQRTQYNQFPSSLSLNRPLPKDKYEQINKLFRRVRSFQPIIEENWKSKYGLTVAVGCNSPIPLLEDINYQSKIFNEQVKLILDSIQRYKMSIISKENFIYAFSSLNLKSKISFNKALEEACGLLLLLPQLILLEFYNYIEKFDLHIPNKEKFKEKYIFDEVENLKYNNSLLSEVADFFENCFEVYLILSKEVDEMTLKSKKFMNALSAFEKARYDICYAINSAENALNNYNKEIKIIKKLNQEPTNYKNYISNCFYDKNKNISSKNLDRQKKLRIDIILGNRKDSACKTNYNYMGMLRNEKKHNKFRSVVTTDLVTKLLKHCGKESKNLITTQRINYELDPNNSEDDDKITSHHKVIKLSF